MVELVKQFNDTFQFLFIGEGDGYFALALVRTGKLYPGLEKLAQAVLQHVVFGIQRRAFLANPLPAAAHRAALAQFLSNPATAIGNNPTGVNTEKRPPTLSGMMNVL